MKYIHVTCKGKGIEFNFELSDGDKTALPFEIEKESYKFEVPDEFDRVDIHSHYDLCIGGFKFFLKGKLLATVGNTN